MQTIGVLGTGEMGSAVGAMLRAGGYRVITALTGRSNLSRKLAAAAGLEDVRSLESLLAGADLFLSILPPATAFDFAQRAAAIIRAGKHQLVYVDCNAVSPETMLAIEALFSKSSAAFVDVGIVGPAPVAATKSPTRFYVSGAERERVIKLGVPELAMIDMGGSIGRASAIKMCYAAMNKGANALYANLLLAARRLGVEKELMAELQSSQPEAASRMIRLIPSLPRKAARFTGEMHEIAATFDAAGVSADFYRGAQWLYEVMASSSLASDTPSMNGARSLEEALAAFDEVLGERSASPVE